MKAPDKIYLPIVEEEGKKLLCAIWWDHDTSKGDKYVKETIPYIRKDAMIEWLESRISSSDGGLIEGLLDLAYKDTIKHLNEM